MPGAAERIREAFQAMTGAVTPAAQVRIANAVEQIKEGRGGAEPPEAIKRQFEEHDRQFVARITSEHER